MLAGFHTESARHIVLSTAGSTGNEDVAVIGDVITVGKSGNKLLVQLSSGCVDSARFGIRRKRRQYRAMWVC